MTVTIIGDGQDREESPRLSVYESAGDGSGRIMARIGG